MDVSEHIVRYGVEAVKKYGCIAGLAHDNEVPEIFIGGSIATPIHKELGLSARVERLYTIIAVELGVIPDADLINEMGLFRADVAIYDANRRPIAIVELKVADERQPLSTILRDRDKMSKLAGRCSIDSYLGIMITDTKGERWQDRLPKLEALLGQKFAMKADTVLSIDGTWHWSFACGKF